MHLYHKYGYCRRQQKRWKGKPYAEIAALFLLLRYFSACAGFSSAVDDTPFQPAACTFYRRDLCPGVEITDIYDARLPLIAHAVKIDLFHPFLSVVTSESALFKDTDGRIRGETTESFSRRRNTVVAFNAAAFKTASLLFSPYRTIVGIHITDFHRMSMPNKRYGALLFYADGTAGIIDSQTEAAVSGNVRHALSGFWTILRNGSILPQKLHRRDSRTAVGLADNGKTLFIIAIEGENKRKSKGLSYEETAALMRELGASDALQLDGGSSSTLVIRENDIQRVIAPSIGWHPPIRVASNAGIVCIE